MSYSVIPETPSVADYMRLRLAGGLTPFAEEAAQKGLGGAYYGVTLIHGDKAVGMGRIIGDGGCFFQIVDIVVEPAHQGKGLGKKIMGALMDHLKEHAPKSAYVSLMADVPADKLYTQFGFKPTAPRSIGMAQVLR